ncbi:MAG: hypothetical protein H0T87_04190 [Gammaproteobacteria bacterium]|nr:hypothetical protein [Gammaproteobacteria bacterium]
MHHKNSIFSIFLMGGFLAMLLAACESPQSPYPTTTTLPNGPTTTTLQNGPTTTTSSTTTTTAPPTPPPPVVLNGFLFTPNALTIRAGQTVTWSHQQPGVPHTVTSDTGVFDSRGGDPTDCSPLIPAACLENTETFTHTFAGPGTFPYHCVVHGGPGGAGMSGTITVNP